MSMSRRLPISCENCRQRKIRCITSNYHAPCDTCLRRGYAPSCRFRRQDTTFASDSRSPDPDTVVGNVSSLEGLLKQNIAVTTALLSQRQGNENRLPSPDSSPAASASASASQHMLETPVDQGQQSACGRLVISPSDHVRFIPGNELGDSELLDAMHESTPGSTGFPFFEQPGAMISDELLDILPPLPQLEELKGAYFRVFSPLFHILHDPTFHARYYEFRQDMKAVSLPFLALLFVVLSLSVTALDDRDPLLMHLGRNPSPGANIRSLSAKYRAAAMRCLVADDFMFRHNLCTVQALVLLIYAMNHAQGPAWSLLGTTLHIAVAIGCAVDPSRLNVSHIEAEERRRCWAALQMLYTIQNTCLGNLMPFRIDSHVNLPADIEDDDLSNLSQSHSDPSSPTRMTYLLYKFRLYNLAFDICQLTSPQDFGRIAALDTRIAHEQQSHFARFRSNARSLSQLEPYHQAHYYILANYTNHLTLLLHRRSLSGNIQSSERCSHAATSILAIFEKLSTDPTFGAYRWYVDGLGSFYAFFSITTLLILHGGGNGQVSVQLNVDTVDLVLRCVDLLAGKADRSAVCSKAAGILQPIVQQLHSASTSHPMDQVLSNNPDQTQTISSGASDEGLGAGAGTGIGWDAFPELENLFFDLPLEHWLSPAGFPWIAS